jgi:E3 ubiquitin-protein ligase HUWE1
VLYGFGNAFQLFCNARGVDALVDRIQFEVDLDLKDYKAGETSENVPGNSYGNAFRYVNDTSRLNTFT